MLIEVCLNFSGSYSEWERDREYSGWSSSRSVPGKQAPGVSCDTRSPACEFFLYIQCNRHKAEFEQSKESVFMHLKG